jgi:hypothetical protein
MLSNGATASADVTFISLTPSLLVPGFHAREGVRE